MLDTAPAPVVLLPPAPAVGSRVRILAGGYRGDDATVTEVRPGGLLMVKTDSLIHLGAFRVEQVQVLKGA